MYSIEAPSNKNVALQRWNLALAALAWLGLAWAVYANFQAIFDAISGRDFALGLKTESGVKLLTADDFTAFQRLLIVLSEFPLELCWVFCLWQIVKLSRIFAKGEILSLEVIKRFELFALGLAGQGLAGALYAPILVAFLVGLQKIDGVEDMWQDVIGGGLLPSMMAAVLLIVVAQILKIGVRLREDAELTI